MAANNSLPIVIDYPKLLHYCTTTSYNHTLVNFFEICLVLNKARPAALVTIKPENVPIINKLFEQFGVELHDLGKTNNICLVVDLTSPLNNETEVNKVIRSYHYAPNHVLMGKILGYMTSIDIMKNRNTTNEKAIEISVDVFDKKTSMDIQLAPQIVQDKSDDEIRAYYEPMLVVLRKLQPYISSSIIVKNIQIKIKPFGVLYTTFESLNNYLIMKLLTKQKNDIGGDWSIILNQYIRNASHIREGAAAAGGAGSAAAGADKQRKNRHSTRRRR